MDEVKYPLGIQTFSDIRENDFLYVDKTMFIPPLLRGKYYFLSRPRRFGKSLFMSTLEAYFEGRRELFEGLAISKTETEWKKWPVLTLRLNGQKYEYEEDLIENLQAHLKRWEENYDLPADGDSVSIRFGNLLEGIYKKTGEQVVVLVDEYDLPLEDALEDTELHDKFRTILKRFYGVMKACDQYVRFGFLTGVTKFGRVGVFSDLNNLRDISMNPEFSAICGATEEELVEYLAPHIGKLAETNRLNPEECLERLRKDYDGYRFTEREERVYNLFSVLSALDDGRFGRYWFRSGTPTLLVKMLQSINYRLSDLDGEVRDEAMLLDVDMWRHDPIPMFFQSGYLTVKDYNPRFNNYILGIPNEEVRQGLYSWLLPEYTGPQSLPGNFNIGKFVTAVENGDVETFMGLLKSLLGAIPYDQVAPVSDKRSTDYEVHYQNLCLMIFYMMGLYVTTEMKTSSGRIDIVVETKKYVYIIELKVRSSARKALEQIREGAYDIKYKTDPREVIHIGATFSPRTHTLRNWKVYRPLK